MSDSVKKAAVAAGVTLGFGLSVFGAPLWASLAGGAMATLATVRLLHAVV